MLIKTIKHYLTVDGKDLYADYFRKIRDPVAKAKIASRVNRMASECFGDHKPCHESIWELHIDQGVDYRVYYSLINGEIILLLLARDKRTQDADINKAILCLKDYLKR